jgi:hypothetical protein
LVLDVLEMPQDGSASQTLEKLEKELAVAEERRTQEQQRTVWRNQTEGCNLGE